MKEEKNRKIYVNSFSLYDSLMYSESFWWFLRFNNVIGYHSDVLEDLIMYPEPERVNNVPDNLSDVLYDSIMY